MHVFREMVGNDLSEVYQELSKMVSFVGTRKEIEVDDVESVVSRVRPHSIFELTEAIGMKNCPKALILLDRMLEGGEPPLRILTMVVRQFRHLWIAREMQDGGSRSPEIAKALGIPGFLAGKFLPQVRKLAQH